MINKLKELMNKGWSYPRSEECDCHGGSGDNTSPLPSVTDADEGKVLMVKDGKWSPSELPRFDGEYEITPSAHSDQTLDTASKLVDADITVKKIPYAETSNSAGGITVTIG